MMKKHNFSQLIERIRRPEQNLRSPKLINPERDWVIGLVVSLVIFSISAIWSAEIYIHNRDIIILERQVDPSEMVIYRESQVKTALEYFASRRREYESLLDSSVQQRSMDNTPAESTDVILIEEATEATPVASTTTEVDEPVSE